VIACVPCVLLSAVPCTAHLSMSQTSSSGNMLSRDCDDDLMEWLSKSMPSGVVAMMAALAGGVSIKVVSDAADGRKNFFFIANLCVSLSYV
jgi:hypothetical protein